MRILLAIPSKNQTRYMVDMCDAISRMNTVPDSVLYMVDRPNAHDRLYVKSLADRYPGIDFRVYTEPDVCPSWIGRPQMTAGEEQFLAGCLRNVATNYAVENGFDAVVYIDGDCIPDRYLVDGYAKFLDSSDPVAAFGKRKEERWGHDDQRAKSPSCRTRVFDRPGTPVDNEAWFVDSGVVWTCNFGLNIAAIDRLRALNERLYGRNEVFSSDFAGKWGGEDGFLGLECLYSGIPVVPLTGTQTGVNHREHFRPIAKYDHVTFIDHLESAREDLMMRMRMSGMQVRDYVPRDELLATIPINCD